MSGTTGIGPCPDWRTLTAHRHAREALEPAGWPEALAHLDGCPACRRAALAADPTLAFRCLPGLPALPAESEAREIESMRQGVAALCAARRLEAPRERGAWKQWAAAAGLAAAALCLGSAPGLPHAPAVPAPSVPALAGARSAAAVVPLAPTPRFASEPVPMPPMVEELNRPAARVYQMDGGKNLSVVMIVDERFDV